MYRSLESVRKSSANIINCLHPHSGRRISVAITALLQLPAFLSSCTAAPSLPEQERLMTLQSGRARALDVFFFDPHEPYLLDSYQQVSGERTSYLISGPGEKLLAALPARNGDIYARASVTRLSDLYSEVFSLEEDSPYRPLAWGLERVEEGASRTLTLNLQPMICAIRVGSVSCDFGGKSYNGNRFHNDRLFLLNVVSETSPLGAEGGRPVSWLNYGCLSSSNPMVTTGGYGDIGPKRVNVDETLYCYPNPAGKPPTRFVLEGTVGDVRCYYPITLSLPRGGLYYNLDITLHRMGTQDPDCDAAPGTFTVEYTTMPWYQGYESEEVY